MRAEAKGTRAVRRAHGGRGRGRRGSGRWRTARRMSPGARPPQPPPPRGDRAPGPPCPCSATDPPPASGHWSPLLRRRRPAPVLQGRTTATAPPAGVAVTTSGRRRTRSRRCLRRPGVEQGVEGPAGRSGRSAPRRPLLSAEHDAVVAARSYPELCRLGAISSRTFREFVPTPTPPGERCCSCLAMAARTTTAASRSPCRSSNGPPRSHARYDPDVSRAADELPSDPAVVVINPDDEVTSASFAAWLDRRQAGEPVDPGVRAADTLAEIRATGEA